MNSHEVFIHIHQGCFAGTGAIVRLPQCQWSKPDGYGEISQCITTTKHSKAKTVCIFLGIYCIIVWLRNEPSNPYCNFDIMRWRWSMAIHWVNHNAILVAFGSFINVSVLTPILFLKNLTSCVLCGGTPHQAEQIYQRRRYSIATMHKRWNEYWATPPTASNIPLNDNSSASPTIVHHITYGCWQVYFVP